MSWCAQTWGARWNTKCPRIFYGNTSFLWFCKTNHPHSHDQQDAYIVAYCKLRLKWHSQRKWCHRESIMQNGEGVAEDLAYAPKVFQQFYFGLALSVSWGLMTQQCQKCCFYLSHSKEIQFLLFHTALWCHSQHNKWG